MKAPILVLCLLLAACANTPKSPSPQEVVAGLELSLATSLNVADSYIALPRCPTPDKLCSDRSVVDKIILAADAANLALQNAEVAVRTPGIGDDKVKTAILAADGAVKTIIDISTSLGAK